MSETELAYLAGIIDGEGSIELCRVKKNSYQLQLRVANTDKRMVSWIKERFGGTIAQWTSHSNPYWSWRVLGQNAISLLKITNEYLVIKKEQVEVVMNYWNNKSNLKGRLLSQSEINMREEYFKKLKSLHLNKGREK